MPPEQEEVTEEQAGEALQQLTLQGLESEDELDEPVAEPSAPAETATEQEPQETVQAQEEVTEDAGDDVESLRKRNEELESATKEAEKRFNERLEALKQRTSSNEQILRDRYLRKSTVADKALKVLRATRSDAGVSEAEVDQAIREMEGTLNPASASYAPPEPSPMANEDQALVLNSFLNEQGMTVAEAEEFGKWVSGEATTAMSPAEQAVASQSLDGFLRLAHTRWQQSVHDKEKESKRDDAVGAVRAVQRTQREAARAASSAPVAPKKQPASPVTETDVSKLTPDDISALLRQSVEQYR